MLPIEAIRWTSRAEVCDLLVQLLRDTPPAPLAPDDPHLCWRRSCRSEVASLLPNLAGPSSAPFLRQLLLNRKDVDDAEEAVEVAINNSLLHLWGYPIDAEERWADFVSVPSDELGRVLDEWRRLKQLSGGGTDSDYFNGLM